VKVGGEPKILMRIKGSWIKIKEKTGATEEKGKKHTGRLDLRKKEKGVKFDRIDEQKKITQAARALPAGQSVEEAKNQRLCR